MSAFPTLDDLLEPLSQCLDPDSLQRVINFRVAGPVQNRIEGLATKANEGCLTDDERMEYEALINAADFIAILKLKAQQQLYRNSKQR